MTNEGIIRKAIEHQDNTIYSLLTLMYKQGRHKRNTKQFVMNCMDELTELLYVRTRILESQPMIDPAHSPELQATIRGYILDALESYRGAVRAGAVGSSADSKLADIDAEIAELQAEGS